MGNLVELKAGGSEAGILSESGGALSLGGIAESYSIKLDGFEASEAVARRPIFRIAKKGSRWDSVKPDVYRLYVLEGKTLSATMATIERIHSFSASLRRWKMKLKEWCYDKYLSKEDMNFILTKADQRARKGKSTRFFHNGSEITERKIKNFRRRKQNNGTFASTDTPSYITYGTPEPEDTTMIDAEDDPVEEDCQTRNTPNVSVGAVSRHAQPDCSSPDWTSTGIPWTVSPTATSPTSSTPTEMPRSTLDVNSILKVWIAEKELRYPLLSALCDFEFEVLLMRGEDTTECPKLELSMLLKCWINEVHCIVQNTTGAIKEALYVGAIVAHEDLADYHSVESRSWSSPISLLDLLETLKSPLEEMRTRISTYWGILSIFKKIFGSHEAFTRRLILVLARMLLENRTEEMEVCAEIEELYQSAIFGFSKHGEIEPLLKCQVLLADYYLQTGQLHESLVLLGRSFVSYLAYQWHGPPTAKEVEAYNQWQASSVFNTRLAHFRDPSAWSTILRQIISDLQTLQGSAEFAFVVLKESVAVASALSKFGNLHMAQTLFTNAVSAIERFTSVHDVTLAGDDDLHSPWRLRLYVDTLQSFYYLQTVQAQAYLDGIKRCNTTILYVKSLLKPGQLDGPEPVSCYDLDHMRQIWCQSHDNTAQAEELKVLVETIPVLQAAERILDLQLSRVVRPVASGIWKDFGEFHAGGLTNMSEHNGSGRSISSIRKLFSRGSYNDVSLRSRASQFSSSAGAASIKFGTTYSEGSVMSGISFNYSDLFSS